MQPPSSRSQRNPARATGWADRCALLFEDMWRPARAMVARAYGKAMNDDEIRDVYSAAWTATLSALRTRGESMNDEELRSYILTAVASHASKEMRRRSRKPAGSLDATQEQVVTDGHQLLPEEQAIGTEARGVARDLLSSLPPRRRAVMLLRYGWGLKPPEICALVSGLSPRAYRKEITRGVAELIERLELLESGEWCKSREPMLRDYVAGTASEDVSRQVTEHLHHCRGCSQLTAKLTSHLHELGAAGAFLAATAGSAPAPTLVEHLVSSAHGVRASISDRLDQVSSTLTSLSISGGTRGSGMLGAGALAKFAGAGGAGKAALVCLGVSAAAGACVATGVVPPLSPKGLMAESHRAGAPVERRLDSLKVSSPSVPSVQLGRPGLSVVSERETVAEEPGPEQSERDPQPEETPEPPAPEPVELSPAQEEFDPVAAAAAPSTAPPQTSSSDGSGKPATTETSSAPSGIAAEEFGP